MAGLSGDARDGSPLANSGAIDCGRFALLTLIEAVDTYEANLGTDSPLHTLVALDHVEHKVENPLAD